MGDRPGDIADKSEQDKKKLKILFTSDSLSVAGIRSLLLDLIIKINSRRFESAVVVVKPLKGNNAFYESELRNRGISVGTLNLRYPQTLFPLGVKRMKGFLSSINPDIVCTTLLSDCFFVVRAAALMSIPIISLYRGATDIAGLSRFKRRILLDHLEFSDGIIALSETAKKSYPRESPTPITVLPPMIDITHYSSSDSHSFGGKQELVIGAIVTEKDQADIPILIRIFSKIRNSLPFVKKLIITGDIGHHLSVKNAINESGFPDSISLLGAQEDIASVYRRIDFLISISGQESMGMAVLEAMSSRVIPLIGENCVLPDVVINGKNGFYIEHGDVESTVQKLEAIFVDCIRNPSKFNKIAKEARDTIRQKFSSDGVIPLYEEIFLRLASSRKK